MDKLQPGAALIHHGVPVQLLWKAENQPAGAKTERWYCKLLFVEETEAVIRTFRKGEPCRAIHGTLSYSL